MKSPTLLALTASALALPGLVPIVAKADSPPANATLSYRISNYGEDKLDSSKLLFGSNDRYDIDIHQLQLTTPLAGNYALSLRASSETMSGASPWYTVALGGDVKVVMSGATISEERTDANAALRRYLDNGSMGFSLGYSDEKDYEALSGGFDMERHFNDNLTTVAGGLSFSNDDLNPTDAVRLNRVRAASKDSRSLFVALTQVLNQNAVVQTGLSYSQLSGYLSDPYKLFDIRPTSRNQVAWTTSLRYYLEGVDAAVHTDYRFYHDSFGINSHTLDVQWFQNLGDDWQLVPGIRYYSQSDADFFRPGSVFGATAAASADFRLSAYGAVSGTMKLQVDIDDITVSLSGERYRSSEQIGMHDGLASPALVNFTRFSLGVDYRY